MRFADKRDAEDAMDGMDGKIIDGREIRIQFAKRKRPADPKTHYSSGRDRRRWIKANIKPVLTYVFILFY